MILICDEKKISLAGMMGVKILHVTKIQKIF